MTTRTTRRRPRSPQGEGGRLRQELVQAAGRLLAATGDEEGLSLRAVAREAGVAAPSIYLHFPDKQELVRAVMEVRFADLHRVIEQALSTAERPDARLRAACLAYCRFGLDQAGAYRVLFDNATTAFPDTEVAELPGSTTIGLLGHAVGAVVGGRSGTAGDPVRVTGHLWAALHGLVSLRRSVPSFPWPPIEEQVEEITAALTRAG